MDTKIVKLFGKLEITCETDLETGKNRLLVCHNDPPNLIGYKEYLFVDELIVGTIKYIPK